MVQFISRPFEEWADLGYTKPGWYFWDETQTYCYGPYVSKRVASEQQRLYAASL